MENKFNLNNSCVEELDFKEKLNINGGDIGGDIMRLVLDLGLYAVVGLVVREVVGFFRDLFN